jgi:RNA polymerase sigma factor (sigma-70 family)
MMRATYKLKMRHPTPTTDWPERSRDLAALLARAGLGDRAAFATLYERTSAHLLGVVMRIQRDRAQAEDILQEVYVNVWRASRGFDAAQSQPLTWLTSIARNRAIDSLRRQQTQPQLRSLQRADDDDTGDGGDAYDNVADEAGGPLELLSQAADARALSACMQGLSAQQRQSVALAFYDGLSHSEVAEQMRQPLGTVKSWVRRALLALKTCLDNAVRRDDAAGQGMSLGQPGAH